MLPAELVDVRLVPGGDATVRSLAAAVGVVAAMKGKAEELFHGEAKTSST